METNLFSHSAVRDERTENLVVPMSFSNWYVLKDNYEYMLPPFPLTTHDRTAGFLNFGYIRPHSEMLGDYD